MLEQNSLERIVSRFNTSEICPSLERWGYLTQNDINEVRMAGSKQNMISEVCNRCMGREIDDEAIGELEILYVQLHSKQKSWNVYELTDSKEESVTSINPAVIQGKLSRRLGHYFEANVSTKVLEKAVWIRLSLSQPMMSRSRQMKFSRNVIYIVHYPRTSFFLSTVVKASFKMTVFETLVAVLGYFSSKEMQLRGHCLKSLADIVLNRNSQGGFQKHKADGHHVNPLTKHRRKRKDQEEELDERIMREDDRKRQKRMDVLENTFGPYVQPSLEKVEFKLETQFRGFAQPQDRNRLGGLSRLESFFPVLEREYQDTVEPKVFQCRVKFEGKNVLEGLRNLAKAGLASVPLPKHLTNVTSQARNYFILGDRTRNSRAQRSPAPA